jgi:hypothetical protein
MLQEVMGLVCMTNPLKTKRILPNIKTQGVPRSKHSPPRFKKISRLMTCQVKVADRSQISKKHIKATWAPWRIDEI